MSSKALFGAGLLICVGAFLSLIILVFLKLIVPSIDIGYIVMIVGGSNLLLGFGAAGIMYEKYFVEDTSQHE